MSQIQTFGISGIPPAGPVLTLTGDDLVAVSPGGGNIFIQSIPSTGAPNYGFATFVGAANDENPAVFPANSLKLQPLFDTLTTNDATVTVFANTGQTLSASSAYEMSAHIVGHRDDYSAAAGGFFSGIARRPAVGAAVLTGDNGLFNSDVALVDCGITIVGNTMYVYVQGLAGETWNWTCTFTFQKRI
ncbi:hypothetical protein [Methylobacter sp.]|uniref:hypothetical protein n=1 Tax=Methylobacter sp. TaxID=2051955 RepID=UPI003DA1D607